MDKVLYWPERALTRLLQQTNIFVYILLMFASAIGWYSFTAHTLSRILSDFTASLIGIVGIMTILMLFMLPSLAREKRRGEANQYFMHSGGAWAEWTCTPEEWQRFVAAEALHRREKRVVLFILFVAAGSFLTLLAARYANSALTTVIILVLSIVGVLIAQYYSDRDLNRRRNLQGPVEIRINGQGIDEAGTFTHLAGTGQYVRDVILYSGNPPLICFVVRSDAGETMVDSEVCVPIPRGREAEAEALVARFLNPARATDAPDPKATEHTSA